MTTAFVGCPISDVLAERVERMIAELRADPDRVARSDIVDLVADLADASFQRQFVRPLTALGVGPTARRGIAVGLKGAVGVIRTSMRQVFRSMDAAKITQLADFLEDAYIPRRES